METRIALIGIIVEDRTVTEKLNKILHDYADYIIGRMGIQRGGRRPSTGYQRFIRKVGDAPRYQCQNGLFKGRWRRWFFPLILILIF